MHYVGFLVPHIEDLQRSKALLQANIGVINMERTLAVDEAANTRQFLSEEALNHKKTIMALESELSSYHVKLDRMEVEKEKLIQTLSSIKIEKADLEVTLRKISNSHLEKDEDLKIQLDTERQCRCDLELEMERIQNDHKKSCDNLTQELAVTQRLLTEANMKHELDLSRLIAETDERILRISQKLRMEVEGEMDEKNKIALGTAIDRCRYEILSFGINLNLFVFKSFP